MNVDATVSRLIKDNSHAVKGSGHDGYSSALSYLQSSFHYKRQAAGCIWSARLIIQHPDKQYARKCHRNYLIQAAGFREQAMRAGK